MSSIKEIAKMADTSIATVSRVLNDPNYKCAKKGMRDRIWKIAVELNYIPNQAARNLKLGNMAEEKKNYYINILMTRTDRNKTDPFFNEVLRVIETELHRNMCILSNIWYNSDFSSNSVSRSKMSAVIDEMYQESEKKNSGLIIIGRCNRELLHLLKKKFNNIVSVNRNSTNYEVDEILCDGEKIAHIAMEYLIKLGHKDIAYVGECKNEARYEGYNNVLRKYDLDVISESIFDVKPTESNGYKVMESILKEEERPTAFYCANDITAIGMLKCLNINKNRYYNPSIISSDNIEEGQFTNPMLTTVNLPKEEIGKFAVELLIDRIKGGHKNIIRFEIEGDLVVRGSCGTVSEANITEYYI